jgi:hypothetical protein
VESASFLAERRQSLESLGDIVRKQFAPLSPNQLAWSQAPREWSVGQCLDHLVVSGNLYLDKMAPLFQAARPSDRPVRHSATGRLIGNMVRPECKLRVPVPKAFEPRHDFPADVVDQLLDQFDRLLKILDNAYGKDLSAKVASPASKLVRINLADVLLILTEHSRRHVLQAQTISLMPNFPPTEAVASS